MVKDDENRILSIEVVSLRLSRSLGVCRSIMPLGMTLERIQDFRKDMCKDFFSFRESIFSVKERQVRREVVKARDERNEGLMDSSRERHLQYTRMENVK